MQMEHSQMPHQPRAEKLVDEAFIPIVGPDVAQDPHHVVFPRDVGKPFTVLVLRIGHDALDVLHDRKTQRIGVEARETRIVEVGLEHHVGMRLQEFEEIAVGDPALSVQAGHDSVMNIGRGALVHDLSLALRIEILRDMAHDAQQLALPGLQTRRRLFQEIQQIFLRQAEQPAAAFDIQQRVALGRSGRDRPPKIVERGFLVQAPLPRPLLFVTQIELLLAGITVDPVRHQGMRGVKRLLDRKPAMALLALRDIGLGKFEIIKDAVGIGPLLEQVVVLEEMVVTERRVRDHQRLHRRAVFLHQVRNTGRRVDDDFVGEAHQTPAVRRFVKREVLAERPVLVEQRHPDRGVGVEHLLGGNHLDLVGIDIEPEFGQRDIFAGIVDALQRPEIPVRSFEQSFGGRGHGATFSCFPRR